MRRPLLAVAAAAAAAAALPGAAFAHAALKHVSPGFQSRLESAPREVTLRFDQSVSLIPHSLEVFAVDGRRVSASPRYGADRRTVRAALSGLVPGGYTVRWRLLSSDGHVGSGVYTFGFRHAAPPPTSAYGASGPTWSDDAARWAYFVSFALLLGGLGVRLLLLREPLPERLSKRFHLLTGVGAVAAIDVGILAFVLRAEDALQLPFVDLLYVDLSPFATKTRFGVAFVAMTLGFALVTALLALAWIFDVPRLLWPAFLVALGFSSGLSLSGNSAVEPNSTWLSQLVDFLHLTAASLWAGGLLALALAVWPLAPELRRHAFLGFSRLATGLVAVLVLAGVYLAIQRLPAVHDLWTSGYGHVLLVKLAVVSVALCWGAAHHFLVRPRLARGDAPGALRRSLLGESSVALAVLLAAALLVNSAPPPRPASGVSQAVARA